MNSNSDRERTGEGLHRGDGPQFQMDFLSDESRGEIGDSPQIRVSTRARRLSVRVYPDARVELVVPPRARPRDVQDFMAAHREWIDAKRAQALCNRPTPQVFPPPAVEFPLTGEHWRLHIAGGAGAIRIAERGTGDAGRVLRVSGMGGPTAVRKALRAWLLRAARPRLEPLVAALSARCGICSARGTISLNVCLLFQPPAVVDYLIVHELTHVKHMNHSVRFWAAVERNCADWRALDAELVQGWRHVPRWVFSDL